MAPAQPVYTVTELVGEMRRLMERSYPQIWIEGELSSLSQPASGHWYFSLKDDAASLRCAMFRSRAGVSRYRPKVGDQVRVRAKISVYPARGDLQCIVQLIEEAGAGALQRQYEELKARLEAEGLFSNENKQAIPTHLRRIGVITSPSGAALQDVLATLKRRNPSIAVIIYPAVVQGEGAAEGLLNALRQAQLNAECDVLLLTRGGGTVEDLHAFNDEKLAREIATCPIPVVSAVGHEVDFTIADFVADFRAPTPTSAAEQLSVERDLLVSTLLTLSQRLYTGWLRNTQQQAQTVDLWFGRLTHPRQAINTQQQAIRSAAQRLNRMVVRLLVHHRQSNQYSGDRLTRVHPSQQLTRQQAELHTQAGALLAATRRMIDTKRLQQSAGADTLQVVNPLATLARGFSVTRDQYRRILRDADSVGDGDKVEVQLARGQLDCTVNKATKL